MTEQQKSPYPCCYWDPACAPTTPLVNTRKDGSRHVYIERLPEEKKQRLWVALKKTDPASADLMADEFLSEIRKTFGAEFVIEQKRFNKLVNSRG